MATQPQAYQAYAHQNKGTLVPGQTISVNKYTVQVERYLSQGGFAHVYLVRTPTPVYNTTHHVLKRIAVANESMLSEVKREVDVMRVLKGHPNIVHLIDAAWHRLPNGTYEVFILMEYCPGGGIIDMMNRRLRERLTEAEILQIFVDVCEGVAFMHNSRPPLLHRDLKVENILQSSPTSYKLCDFGSATTVQRPPTNTQEIRALEADLGRHTTMQYRSPEMIDLYSKRPIDEKSDIWALGVLLYKLCYYTTPFEEHGSLAILNVQYRIPPYPVYSNQMNMLIGSMLREHGTQRPTVFELLKHVHQLRGTKSAFNYNIPVQQPIVPRHPPIPTTKPAPSPNLLTHGSVPNGAPRQNTNPIRSAPIPSAAPGPSVSTSSNQGVQAREKVLEAIAPMRRGRPVQAKDGSSSRQHSPQKSNSLPKPNHPATQATTGNKELNWLDKEEAAWKSTNAQAEARERAMALFDEAWKVPGGSVSKDPEVKSPPAGFDNDFAEKLWRAPNPNSTVSTPPVPRPSPKPMISHGHSSSAAAIIKPLSHTGGEGVRGNRDKDAFEGLGLMTSIGKPAPTLAEARKLRTGLAYMSTQTNFHHHYRPSEPSAKPAQGSPSARPTPSPRPSYLSPTNGFQGPSRSPTPSTDMTRSSPASAALSPASVGKDGMPIESRFPSLEELDAQFSTTSLYPASAQGAGEGSRFSSRQPQSAAVATPPLPPRPNQNGMKEEEKSSRTPAPPPSAPATLDSLEKKLEAQSMKSDWKSSSNVRSLGDGNSGDSRGQTGSATMRYAMQANSSSRPAFSKTPSSNNLSSADTSGLSTSPSKQQKPRQQPPQQRDWLTGSDNDYSSVEKSTTGPIVRDAPAKRTSVIIQNDMKLHAPAVAQYDTTPIMKSEKPLPPEESPTARFAKAFPALDTAAANDNFNRNEPLTDNWSPIASTAPQLPPKLPPKDVKPRRESVSASSAEDEGPEDLGGLSSSPKKGSLRPKPKHKGRQSSVHELVDLWGGKDKPSSPLPDSAPLKPALVEKPAIRPKPRPTSLMPPGRTTSITGRSVSGSPRVSPIQRDPSPKASPSPLETSFSPSNAVSPTSGRSRPQSMMIFPSKSAEILNQSPRLPSTLAPPPEESENSSRPSARRKTSITDMVNRYEAIGGKVITPQQVQATPVARKPSFTRNNMNVPPTQTEVGRVKVLPVAEKPAPSGAPSVVAKDEFRPGRISETKPRTRALSTGPVRPSLDIPVTSAKPQRASPLEKPSLSPKKTVSGSVSRPTLPPKEAQEAPANTSTVVFPKRKTTMPSVEDLPGLASSTATATANSSSDGLSSSPERPYQGVGKLIDQWQRKTEQNDGFARPPVKRPGLVFGNRS